MDLRKRSRHTALDAQHLPAAQQTKCRLRNPPPSHLPSKRLVRCHDNSPWHPAISEVSWQLNLHSRLTPMPERKWIVGTRYMLPLKEKGDEGQHLKVSSLPWATSKSFHSFQKSKSRRGSASELACT